jgi:hypothetical protein
MPDGDHCILILIEISIPSVPELTEGGAISVADECGARGDPPLCLQDILRLNGVRHSITYAVA